MCGCVRMMQVLYMRGNVTFVFLGLVYFILHNDFQAHPLSCE